MRETLPVVTKGLHDNCQLGLLGPSVCLSFCAPPRVPQARYPVAAPAVCCTAFAGILAPVLLTAVHAYNTGCDKAAVTKAVDVSMPQFALGMLLISICA